MAFKELISTVVVGSGGAASIDFTSIPNTYTDLMVTLNVRTNRALTEDWILLTLNGSTSNFSSQILRGSGSAVTAFTQLRALGDAPAANATANTFSNQTLYIPNYTSSINKVFSVDSVSENNATAAWQYVIAGLWSNTAAITSITLTPEVGTAFAQYSTASIYGIRRGSDGTTTPSTTGGIITTSGGYTFHVFTSSGTFSPTRSLVIDGVVIGGGGGGAGGAGGGGGGGGGYQAITSRTIEKGSYSVVIGAGGTNGTGSVVAGDGGDSSFLDITSFGGAGGGQTDGTGRNGASGSGNGSFRAGGGLGIAGQGTNGGDAGSGSPYNAGGGGGAGTAGSGQNGGSGAFLPAYTFPTSTGVSGYLAGGGGGGTYYSGNSVGSGGAGGGGAGTNSNGSATSGTANTGGGGGGSGNQYNNGQGSTGGSGIVIIRYPTPA